MVATATVGQLRRRFDEQGYVVLPAAVSTAAVACALRLLNLSIRRHGLTPDEIAACQLATFFPHLRWEPDIWAALPPTAAELLGWQEGDRWGDPQLLLRFPDEAQDWPLQPHVDELPEWAGAGGYRGIVGVALTDAGPGDGGPCVWPGSHRDEGGGASSAGSVTAVTLRAGDALVMHAQLGHTGTLNLGATIRTAVYFRLVAGPFS